MSDTTVTASWVIDRTKRLVDQLPPAELAQQIADIKQQLADAKAAGQKNRAKSLRRALRTRDCYLSRENAKPAPVTPPAESAPVESTEANVIAPAKKARAKKAK